MMTASRNTFHTLLAALATTGALVLPAPAVAHAEHGQPQYGGVVAEAGVFQGELTAGPRGLTVYLTQHGEPLPTVGASAKLTVLSGGQRNEVTLVPAGRNQLVATGHGPVATGTKVVATIRLADGRSGALRFEVR